MKKDEKQSWGPSNPRSNIPTASCIYVLWDRYSIIFIINFPFTKASSLWIVTCNQNNSVIDCYFDNPQLTMLLSIPDLFPRELWARPVVTLTNKIMVEIEAMPVSGLYLNWPGSFCFLPLIMLAFGILLGDQPSHDEANESAMWINPHVELALDNSPI